MSTLFLIAALVAAQTQQGGGAAAATVRSEVQGLQERAAAVIAGRSDLLELTLAAPVQLPNGRQVGASVRSAAGAEPWFVYSRGNLCQSVITRGPAPTDATDGWKVTVVERSRAGNQVMVTITWLRMWERGIAVASASGGTNELTLKRGDRIPLDTITRPSEPGVCAGTLKTLEIQVGPPIVSSPVPPGEAALDGTVDVEVWMVHRAPNGAETAERQTVRLINGAVGFGFRTAPIDTTDGPVSIELAGQLKAVRRDDNSRGLWAGLRQAVIRQSNAGIAYANTTATTEPWPVFDVLSLELPPLQLSAGGSRSVRGGGGGGGRGGVVSGAGAGTGSTTTAGGQGSGVTGVARGSAGAGAVAAGGRGTPPLPNLLEGHRLSLRVRLVETTR